MNKRTKSNSIRIIAGAWRGRRVSVLESEGLRPTTDRVRETLFNWLMHDVCGANCLDLFAGSGVLGFECLSRGAQFVQFVERDNIVAKSLESNLNNLVINDDEVRSNVVQQDGLKFLNVAQDKRYDIVFLDPPFQSSLAEKAIELLVNNDWLSPNALVYLEQDSSHEEIDVPEHWQIYRQGSAGQSRYMVYSCE